MTRLRVLILVLALVACRAPTTATGTNPDGTEPPAYAGGGPVLLVGDSILVGADEIGHVRELLHERGWEPEIDASVGRSPRTAIGIVTARDSVPADVVVVLGSNPSPTLGNFPAEIEEMITALRERGARRIVWIPPRHAEPERYAEREAALLDVAERRKRMSVPDWGGIVAEYPWIIGGDGLHLTSQGYVLLAYFIGSALSVANGGAGPASVPDPDATPPPATYDREPPPSTSVPSPSPSPTDPSPSPTPSPSPSPSPTRTRLPVPPSPSPLPTATTSSSPSPSPSASGSPTPSAEASPSPSASPSATPSSSSA